MRGRQCLARRRFKIHHVECLVGRGNHFVALRKGFKPAKKFPLCHFATSQKTRERTSKKTWDRQHRAGRQHLEEFSPSLVLIGRAIHGHSPLPTPATK